MNLADARAELQAIEGLDLEDAEANRLLNEGDQEMCVRSGWTRANVEAGPTVADQAAYALSTSVFRPMKLYVNAVPYVPADELTVQRIVAGELSLRANGLWWLSFDPSGTESISLYPTPTTADLPVTVTSIVFPPAWDDDAAEPTTPPPFQRGIIHYVKSISVGGSEDDPEGEDTQRGRFEDYVERLRRFRNARTGSGPVSLRIAGITA